MLVEFNESELEAESKIEKISSLVRDLLGQGEGVNKICDEIGYTYRDRVYNPMTTVWLFICQVLSKDHSCQQAVNRFNAYRVARGLSRVASKTTAYCNARGRLPEQLFDKLLQWTAQRCETAVDQTWLFHGRVVEMIDGWTVTMADTEENQQEYPQQRSQRKGCGFPTARMIGLFSLATGVVKATAIAAYRGKQTGETSLFRSILDRVLRGRILLADRYYATYWLLALGEMKGIDMVARAHHLRKVDFRRGLKIGYMDQVVMYHKPARPKWMSKDEYEAYPSCILVRHLKYKVEQKGFRTREVTLATTLLDPEDYSAEELAELYGRRWQVELHIRSLKTVMQMDHLRCKSPSMVRKEIYCHMIGFNLVRASMVASALRFNWTPARLSFTNAMQLLEEFGSGLRLNSGRRKEQWDQLLQAIAEIEVGNRPGRQEKRVRKRRPKNYKLMKTPRNPNRNRYATAA